MDAFRMTKPQYQTPYTLNIGKNAHRALTFSRKAQPTSSPVSSDMCGRCSRSSLVVFRNCEEAVHFRDEFIACSNLQHREWDATHKPVFTDDNFGMSYKTAIKFNNKKNDTNDILPVPFEFEDTKYLDKLITYNVSVFLFDGYIYNPAERTISVFGNMWSPPTDIVYFPSDIETLYNKE